MPNPKPNTKGLTRGKGKALEALGVEPLEEDEISKPVRVRAARAVHNRLSGMSAKQIGRLLEAALAQDAIRKESEHD